MEEIKTHDLVMLKPSFSDYQDGIYHDKVSGYYMWLKNGVVYVPFCDQQIILAVVVTGGIVVSRDPEDERLEDRYLYHIACQIASEADVILSAKKWQGFLQLCGLKEDYGGG